MSYNRSFMITRKVTNLIEADVATIADKVTGIDPTFRASKTVEGEVTKYLLDFGTDTPQIEMIINGDSIDARFIVKEAD